MCFYQVSVTSDWYFPRRIVIQRSILTGRPNSASLIYSEIPDIRIRIRQMIITYIHFLLSVSLPFSSLFWTWVRNFFILLWHCSFHSSSLLLYFISVIVFRKWYKIGSFLLFHFLQPPISSSPIWFNIPLLSEKHSLPYFRRNLTENLT